MTQFDHEIEIEAPIEYVFDWGTASENWQRSSPSLVNLEVLDHTDEGTHYRNTVKMLGRTTVSNELYTVDKENYRTTSVFDDDDMSGEMVYEYTETDNGTHIRLHGDIETGDSLFERAIRPVVSRSMNRQFRATMETMKDLIEAEYTAERQEASAS
jgi:ligand-binding SRPBCC domain-containing protein